ncbi:CTP synthetase [Rhodobacteraceae bacterium D3-12]|nr:CTP synthetase [Rhodobacteraceae bacterium D3-12]
MLRLAFIVHLFVGSTLTGVAMVVALTMGWDTLQPLLVAALLGYLVSIPASWLVAKQISNL